MRIPIWSFEHPAICSDIYLRHGPIGFGSGEAVTKHLLEMLKSMGFPITYIRNNISGMAMDGQYTGLHVDDHMSEVLLVETNLSWDPAHKLELSHKDSKKSAKGNFVESTLSLINQVLNHFKVGNNFEYLLSLKDLSDNFCSPKSFKDMKFIGHSSAVFDSFINDFKSYIAGLNKCDDDFILRDKLLDSYFIFNMLFLSDTCKIVSKVSKMVQQVNKLPWEYGDNVDQLVIALERATDSLEKLIKAYDDSNIINDSEPQGVSTFVSGP